MNERIIESITNPKHMKEMKNADAIGTVGKISCGDVTRVYLKIKDNIITDASFITYGCGISIASASIGIDMIIGKTLEEAAKITNEDILKELNNGKTSSFHCYTLTEEAIKEALKEYANKKNITINGLEMPEN